MWRPDDLGPPAFLRKEGVMKRSAWTTALAVGGGLLLASLAGASPRSEKAGAELDVATNVRKELAGLPYYGVFDLLTYKVSDNGVVTLGGCVYQLPLREDAERVVRRIKGVKDVQNKIERLPVSPMDDDLRGAVYQAIYRDSVLSRYGTPDDMLTASRPRFRAWGRGFHGWAVFGEPRWSGRPFLGMEPVGNYAIHIIVQNGNLTLVGVVDSQPDKDLATIRAKGVGGVFAVTNDLQVETRPKVQAKAK
jgi:hypothetical protein